MTKWPMVPLGEVLKLRTPDVEVRSDGEYHFAGILCFGRGAFQGQRKTGLEFAYKRLTRLHTHDFTYPKLMAWEGAFAVVPSDCDGFVVSPEFPVFTIDQTKAVPAFIGHYFKRASTWSEIAGQSPGTNVRRKRLHPSVLLMHSIPLPSMREQQQLVEYLDTLTAKIDEAKQLRAEIEVEADLLSIRVLEKLRHNLLSSCPNLTRLGLIAKVTAGGTPSRDNPLYWNGTIPWIKTGELLDGPLVAAAEHITEAAVKASSAKLFPVDTVLVALYGQGQTRGRTGLLTFPATTNQACAAILPCELLRPRYLQYWLRSLYREMREENHGGAQPNWNGQMIKEITIAIPSLEDQERIIRDFDALTTTFQHLNEVQQQIDSELESVLPAVLHQTFNGEAA
jgi:type I restriction enzyme S subunit